MKTCNACGIAKPLNDFPPDTQNRDRRKGKCRACVLERQRQLRAQDPTKDRNWRARNRDRVNLQQKAYRRRHQEKVRRTARERARALRATPEGAARACEIVAASRLRHLDEAKERDRAWAKKNAEKRRAHSTVKKAIKSGRLIRPTACGRCGRDNVRTQAHHADYSRRLDVEFICARCHRRHHTAVAQEVSRK